MPAYRIDLTNGQELRGHYPTDLEAMAKALAQDGYVIFNVTYASVDTPTRKGPNALMAAGVATIASIKE